MSVVVDDALVATLDQLQADVVATGAEAEPFRLDLHVLKSGCGELKRIRRAIFKLSKVR